MPFPMSADNEKIPRINGAPASSQMAWPAAPPAKEKPKSYLVRHWRGQLSLAVSFWVNWVLVNISFGLSHIVVNPNDIFVSNYPKSYAAFWIVIWIASPAIMCWQLVGLWRAGTNYRRQGKPAFRAHMVQILVLLGLLQDIRLLVMTGLPQMKELALQVLGLDSIGSYRLRGLSDTELEIAGYIVFGLTDAVRLILDTHPHIRIVHLNSLGGRVVEARKLRDMIAARSMITYTSSGCASACTLAYAAGKERIMAKDGLLGFHRYSFAGARVSDNIYNGDKKDWLARGFRVEFIQTAFSISHTTLWTPTHNELLQAGVITRFAADNEVAVSGLEATDRVLVEQDLLRDPVFAAMKKYEPNTYEQWLTYIRSLLLQGKSSVEVRAEFRPIMVAFYKKQLPYVSDSVARKFAALVVEQINYLETTHGSGCYDYFFDGEQLDTPRPSEELQRKESGIIAEVIMSAKESGRSPPNSGQIQRSMSPIVGILQQRYRDDEIGWLTDPAAGKKDKLKMCRLFQDSYREILNRPEKESGQVLRYLLAIDRQSHVPVR